MAVLLRIPSVTLSEFWEMLPQGHPKGTLRISIGMTRTAQDPFGDPERVDGDPITSTIAIPEGMPPLMQHRP
ncbi:MAG TPA: hypothetical protein VHL57_11470 [Flavobacteriales bacterium]|jgi:hypothetical protein|nr:hypothetical protein [Flavobacteriales bacterium]